MKPRPVVAHDTKGTRFSETHGATNGRGFTGLELILGILGDRGILPLINSAGKGIFPEELCKKIPVIEAIRPNKRIHLANPRERGYCWQTD